GGSAVQRVGVGGNARRGRAALTAMRVLVADDHPPTRAGVRLALERGGFEVCSEAADATSAVAAARRDRPDVCLLDINMPGNGIHAAAAMSRDPPHTPLGILTVPRTDSDLFHAPRRRSSRHLPTNLNSATSLAAPHPVPA